MLVYLMSVNGALITRSTFMLVYLMSVNELLH